MFIQTTSYVLNRDGSVRQRGPREGCIKPVHVKSLMEEHNLDPKKSTKEDAATYGALLNYYMDTPEGMPKYQWDQISRMIRTIGHMNEDIPHFVKLAALATLPKYRPLGLLGLHPRREVVHA